MTILNKSVLFVSADADELVRFHQCFERALPNNELFCVSSHAQAEQLLDSQEITVLVVFSPALATTMIEFIRRVELRHVRLPITWLMGSAQTDVQQETLRAMRMGINFILFQGEYDTQTLQAVIVGAIEIKRKSLLREHLDKQLSRHDELTGLFNLNAFLWSLQELLSLEQAASTTIRQDLALLRIDVDRHDALIGSLGRGVFDLLLVAIAARLSELIETTINPARLRDSSFILLIRLAESIPSSQQYLTDEANRLIAGLSQPFDLVVEEVFISVSIGISVPNADTDDAEQFVAMAEQALKHAKDLGGASSCHYSDALNQQSLERLHLGRDLHYALDRDELQLYYQPLVDVITGKTHGAEALLRWFKPDQGLISPELTISLAEEVNLIGSLGDWILSNACQMAVRMQSQIDSEFAVSVNISAKQILLPDFYDSVVTILSNTGLQAKYLTLEIVETVLMTDFEATRLLLKKLSALGIAISIDDFGTGYSSLQYLSQLPVNELKIDRSFVMKILDNDRDITIVQAIISLARNLNMGIVAEGIESKDQWQALQVSLADDSRCQGYYFSRPKPEAEFIASYNQH